MSEDKKAEGLRFIFRLDLASTEKGKLLELARDSIRESHSHRTFSDRKDLLLNPDTLHINSAYATGHAIMNANFSTNDKLYMIMHRYVSLVSKENPKMSQAKALEKFRADFAAAYPQEFGAKAEPQKANGNQILLDSIRAKKMHGMV